MAQPEQKPVPEWAREERGSDLAWLGHNLHVFWPAAQSGFKEQGRGAIVVDTTVRPTGEGHPFAYFAEKLIDEADALRMVRAYDPKSEFVSMLLKSQGRVSTYRVRVL